MSEASLTRAAGKRLLVNNKRNTSPARDPFEKPGKIGENIWEETTKDKGALPGSVC
jgi:hypothetical protein